jgi:hypothetical protein
VPVTGTCGKRPLRPSATTRRKGASGIVATKS